MIIPKGSGGGGRPGRSGGGANPEVMTYDEFKAKTGVSGILEEHGKMRFPHGITESQQKKLRKANAIALEKGIAESKASSIAYNEAVKSGKIRPPTRIESLIAKAKGNPDNEGVKAARRVLTKQGIKW